MNLLSLFSGIGAFEKALDNIGVDYNLLNYCEFDKYASRSYSAVHNVPETKNLGDITKIDISKLEPHSADIITYGFPCQDISVAGKQKGFKDENGLTRSGLFFYAAAIIGRIQPKIAICENVKALTSKKFTEEFNIVLKTLEEMGYNNYGKVLNAKDYGIPQNRERVFIVSIRKDIDDGKFKFPEPMELKLRLKDMLDDVVDEKFYLNDEQISKVKIKNADALMYDKSMIGFENNAREYNDICPTITSREWKEPRLVNASGCIQVGTLDIKGLDIVKRVYSGNGLSPTLTNMQGGNRQPKVAISQATKQGFAECEVGGVADLSYPNSKTRRGRVQDGGNICPTITAESNGLCRIEEPIIVASRGRNPENPSDRTAGNPTEQRLEPNTKGLCNTLTSVQKDNLVLELNSTIIDDTQGFDGVRAYDKYSPTLRVGRNGLKTIDNAFRIRKLTPKECWRLMGFNDADFEKAEKVNSNTQLYKQSGNSICVSVLEELFKCIRNVGLID